MIRTQYFVGKGLMSDLELRTRQLQQIPVFALRRAVGELLDDPGMDSLIRVRLREVLGRRPRDLKRAIQRLTREQLTRLINACPELADDEVQGLFEEYRYGVSPSFNIYLFNTGRVPQGAWQGFRPRFEAALEAFNKPLDEGLARVRAVCLNDLTALPDRPEIMEGNYRFLSRLDYVDADENVVSVYQTLYGFFWVNTALGYAIIQARAPEALDGLRRALVAAAGIALEPLVISKHLKNELTFLSHDALRSSRLHDPDPKTARFRWLTIADDDAYKKGYDEWEERYPEVRSLRYRETIGEDRETSLTVRCDQAAFGLAGRLKASEFRAWCLNRLGQLIMILDQMRANLPQYVQTHALADAPEMKEFEANQQEQILRIVSALLTVKQTPGLDQQPIDTTALELAALLGPLVSARILFDHPTIECDEEGEILCPECGEAFFTVTRGEEGWSFACQAGKKTHWTGTLPLSWQCDQGHEFVIDENTASQGMHLLPSNRLAQTIRKLVNLRLPGYHFEPDREGFEIRGSRLIYYPDRKQITTEIKTEIYSSVAVNQAAPGSNITGVSINKATGDVSVDSRSNQNT